MANQASLGKLEVVIAGTTNLLDAATDRAKAGMQRLGTEAKKTSAIIANHWATISKVIGAVVASITTAVALAIKQNAENYKLAKSLGLTTEALTKLQYATSTAGLTSENFSATINKVNQAINELALVGNGPGAQALRAMGIAAKGAAGALKTADAVIGEIADKFKNAADGAAKSALAIQLFGEQGTKLIPILNKGSAGMQELYREAEKLGVVLDQDTARRSAEFMATMNRIWQSVKGTVMLIAEKLLPTLQLVADEFIKTGNEGKVFHGVIDSLAFVFKGAVSIISAIVIQLKVLATTLIGIGAAVRQGVMGNFAEAKTAITEMGNEVGRLITEQVEFQKKLWGGVGEQQKAAAEVGSQGIAQLTTQAEAFKITAQDLNNAFREAMNFTLDDPTKPMIDKLRLLEEAVKRNAMSWYEFQAAVKNVKQENVDQMNDMVSSVSGALDAMFKDNKGVAIATALINTYQAVTKALASAAPPYNFVMAAAAAAQGFAAVRAITSTQKTSTGAGQGRAAGGGGAGAGGGNGGNNGGGAAGPQQTLYVQGINRNALFSGDAVRDIAERLIQYQKDGGRVVLGPGT